VRRGDASDGRVARRPVAPRIGRRVLLALFSALFVLYVAGPVAWLLSSSLQTEAQATAIPPNWLPPEPTLVNFDAIFRAADRVVTYETRRQGDPATGGFLPSGAQNLMPSLWNSLTVGLWVAGLNLLLSLTAAYAIAVIDFRGRRATLYTVLATRVTRTSRWWCRCSW
jgi:multiple sugar transport system permease protein